MPTQPRSDNPDITSHRQRDPAHRPDEGLPDLAVVDRQAARKITMAALVAIVIAALAAGTVAIVISRRDIGVLKADLQQRRAVRDQEAAENVRQQQQGRADLCTALRHLVDPDDPALQDIRRRYHCPPTSTPPPGDG